MVRQRSRIKERFQDWGRQWELKKSWTKWESAPARYWAGFVLITEKEEALWAEGSLDRRAKVGTRRQAG